MSAHFDRFLAEALTTDRETDGGLDKEELFGLYTRHDPSEGQGLGRRSAPGPGPDNGAGHVPGPDRVRRRSQIPGRAAQFPPRTRRLPPVPDDSIEPSQPRAVLLNIIGGDVPADDPMTQDASPRNGRQPRPCDPE